MKTILGGGRESIFDYRRLPPWMQASGRRDMSQAKGMSRQAKDEWDQLVAWLFGLAMEEPGPDATHVEPRPRTLRFTDEARQLWCAWHKSHWDETDWDCFPPLFYSIAPPPRPSASVTILHAGVIAHRSSRLPARTFICHRHVAGTGSGCWHIYCLDRLTFQPPPLERPNKETRRMTTLKQSSLLLPVESDLTLLRGIWPLVFALGIALSVLGLFAAGTALSGIATLVTILFSAGIAWVLLALTLRRLQKSAA
jgi:hypothetical protein